MLPDPCMPSFASPFGSHYVQLFGRLFLAHADVAQRMQYLVCRLSVGASENCLRNVFLRQEDVCYVADRAELEERLTLLLEAGAEGCVTIVRGYIEEFTQAHIRCLEAAFGTTPSEPPFRLLPFVPRQGVSGGRGACPAEPVSAAG